MFVRMKVSIVGPDVTAKPGDVVEFSAEECARLIDSDFAEEVKAPAEQRETATSKRKAEKRG